MAAQLAYWEPEDRAFWAREGARVARRNLALSIPALILSFAVWMMWSVAVVSLPHLGYRFSTNQLFWLAAAPGLAGGTLRLLFAFIVPLVGGRTWTTLSTAMLLVPTLGFALAVQDPATGYPTFLALALAAGIGGGNFASSMANVSLFYPADRKGAALGLNAGLGNLGVSLAQLAIPLAVGVALFGELGGLPQTWSDASSTRQTWMQNAGLVWVPAIVLVAAMAWRHMDDITALQTTLADQAAVVLRPDTWVLAWLYLGTFGSFIGFAAGFPLLAETELAGRDATGWAFAGPLLAALARPLGGWLADRVGGARVALACFAALALAVAGMLLLGAPGSSLAAFLALFGVVFLASGAGNGAVFQLIPAVFTARRRGAAGVDAAAHARAVREASMEGAAALGFTSAIAAFGGFFIPKAYGTAAALTGTTAAALYLFLVFYLSCMFATWWWYLRRAVQPIGPDTANAARGRAFPSGT